MKSIKKVLALALALAMVVTAVPVTSAEAATTGVPKTKTYYAGKTYTLKLTTPKSWKSVKSTWSEKSSAVSLSSKKAKSVKVKAIKAGSATVKVKVTYKKSSKKYTKNYSCKVTVKNSSISAPATAEVVEGATVSVKATAKPASAKVAYVSDNTEVATVDANGVVTGVKAGTAKITATATCGTVKKTAETTVTVKAAVAQLTAVKQTASNAFVATFSATTPQYTKDDITVKNADNTEELAVKSVEYAKDGLSATVTLQKNFTDAKTYKVTCKETTLDLLATVGAVDKIVFNNSKAQKNVATAISFTLFDKNGINVTPNVDVDATCNITIDGTYSSAEIDKASTAKITMANVGDKANVTITYSTNNKDALDVVATQEFECVAAEAVKGEQSFLVGKSINAVSECAKFYNNETDKEVKVAENASAKVYFCAKQDEYNAVNYDSYEVESANDSIATATIADKDAGKYATITVQGNTAGTTQLNVTAIKNDQKTNYTIPVTVTKAQKAVKMTVEIDKAIMSNVDDKEYAGMITAKLFDKDGVDVTRNGNYDFEITTKSADINIKHGSSTDNTCKVTAQKATPKTYTIKVTGSDKENGTGETFTKSVTVTVKKLADDAYTDKGIALTYQIEMNNSLDENPDSKAAKKVTARLYATYNGLFAGYVRKTGDGIKVAGGYYDGQDSDRYVRPTTSTALDDVQVVAKFGTVEYGIDASGNGNLYNKKFSAGADADSVENSTESAILGNGYQSITSGSAITFNSLDSGNVIAWSLDGTKNVGVAKEGTYTLAYKLFYSKDNGKSVLKTNIFKVTNSIVKPKVKVVANALDDIELDTIIKNGLRTNVDMNNNEVDNTPSIIGLADYKYANTDQTKRFAKYAVVKDNYGTQTWQFFTGVNATFSIK